MTSDGGDELARLRAENARLIGLLDNSCQYLACVRTCEAAAAITEAGMKAGTK